MENEKIGVRSQRTGDLICPHCRCDGKRRTSRPITDQHREIHYQCSNVLCGHTWRASLSYDYGIVPSAIPDPAVDLPLRPVSRQDALEALRELDPDQIDLFPAPSSSSPIALAAPVS